MKKTALWMGTDALTLVTNPPTSSKFWYLKLIFYRLKWRVLHRIFDNHYIIHERLRVHLLEFGVDPEKISVAKYGNEKTKKRREFSPPEPGACKKQKHKGFNILYYHPRPACLGGETYIRWKYGIDLIEKAKEIIDYNFIRVDGTQDLSEVYPIVDFYLRPSRHDGLPRMNLECEANNIPYYYSDHGHPDLRKIINSINYVKSKKS